MQHLPSVRHLIYFESRKRPQVDGFPSDVLIHSMSNIDALGEKPESRQGSYYFIFALMSVIETFKYSAYMGCFTMFFVCRL